MQKYVKSQSLEISDVGSILDAHTEPCMNSICQLWVFPEARQYHNHWAQEVWSSISSVKKLKSTKKFPKPKFIFQNTYEDNEHIIPNCIEKIIIKESDLLPDTSRSEDISGLKSVMRQYFDWLSQILSEKGYISSDECYDELRLLDLL